MNKLGEKINDLNLRPVLPYRADIASESLQDTVPNFVASQLLANLGCDRSMLRESILK